MSLLLAGITVWFVVHLFPAAAPAQRENIVFKLGENPYKGIFSLLILLSLVMIVFGWKSAIPTAIYAPVIAPGILTSLLMFVALTLFFAAQMQGHLRRILRHPQMLGTLVWAVTHLLTNGDSRSLALFGAFAVWAALEIVLCNRRDGPRREMPAAAAKFDVIAVVIGAVAWGLLGRFHLQLFGVAPM